MQKLEDPAPKQQIGEQTHPIWRVERWISLPKRFPVPNVDLFGVLEERRSGRNFKEIQTTELSALLWYTQRRVYIDRTNTDKTYGPTATAGALASVRTLIVDRSNGTWLYDGLTHRAGVIAGNPDVTAEIVGEANNILDLGNGSLLLFAADRLHVERYYFNPESLVLREAGVITGAMALVSTALGLTFCPLGTQATSWVMALLGVGEEVIVPGGAAVVGGR